MPNHRSAAASVLIARAEAVGKALAPHGWTSREEPRSKHPGTHRATIWTPRATPDVSLLLLTIGGKHGQIAELSGPMVPMVRAQAGRRIGSRPRPSWRLTAYDAPASALASAALTATNLDRPGAKNLQEAGWRVVRHVADGQLRPVMPEFIRPDGAISAAFRPPTFTPPCERCQHYGDLGDAGGWSITGPGFVAEATAHTPEPVVTAFVLAMPGSDTVPVGTETGAS